MSGEHRPGLFPVSTEAGVLEGESALSSDGDIATLVEGLRGESGVGVFRPGLFEMLLSGRVSETWVVKRFGFPRVISSGSAILAGPVVSSSNFEDETPPISLPFDAVVGSRRFGPFALPLVICVNPSPLSSMPGLCLDGSGAPARISTSGVAGLLADAIGGGPLDNKPANEEPKEFPTDMETGDSLTVSGAGCGTLGCRLEVGTSRAAPLEKFKGFTAISSLTLLSSLLLFSLDNP